MECLMLLYDLFFLLILAGRKQADHNLRRWAWEECGSPHLAHHTMHFAYLDTHTLA